MSATPEAERPAWFSLAFWSLLAAALAYRVQLVLAFPTVYSWDAFTRLLDPGRLLVRHWMPIPQLPIYAGDVFGWEITAVRLAYALIGVAAVGLIGAFVVRTQGPREGLVATAVAAVLPGFAVYTIVPYQEGVLLCFLFLFLCLWRADVDTMSATARTVAAVALGLACLSRYEAWIFAGLFALRPIAARRRAALPIFVPALGAIAWWLVTLPSLDQTNPMATPVAAPEAVSLEVALAALREGAQLGLAGLHWVGLPVAALGAVAAARRGGLLGREVLAFWIGLVALSLARTLHSAEATTRMTVLPLVLATLYLPSGLRTLARFRPLPVRVQQAAGVAFVVAMVVASTFAIDDFLEKRRRHYRDERSVALHLLEVTARAPASVRIGLVPKEIDNAWGESAVKAIFGQSMRLRVDDPRFRIGRERVAAERTHLDRVLLYDTETDRYIVVSPNDPALGVLYSTR
ncbi:MAG: glycosyltransferase family 39 protein [Myxococcota bacterium]